MPKDETAFGRKVATSLPPTPHPGPHHPHITPKCFEIARHEYKIIGHCLGKSQKKAGKQWEMPRTYPANVRKMNRNMAENESTTGMNDLLCDNIQATNLPAKTDPQLPENNTFFLCIFTPSFPCPHESSVQIRRLRQKRMQNR